MSEVLADALRARLPLVLDGALGTELERRGVPTPAPLWSAAALHTAPNVVSAIHQEYALAGADVLVANTFRTNPRTLERARLDDGAALCAVALALARAAGSPLGGSAAPGTLQKSAPLIAASVAPVEDCYAPALVPDETTLAAEHKQLATWLKAAGPDLLWIETMGTVREAVAAAAAARGVGLPFTVSWMLAEGGALLGGEPLDAAVAAVAPLGPAALGLNCIPPDGITRYLPALRRLTSAPVAVYAHIGNQRPTPGWSFAQPSVLPAEYAEYSRRWRDLGADIIGGCCGTTPAHIAAVAQLCRS